MKRIWLSTVSAGVLMFPVLAQAGGAGSPTPVPLTALGQPNGVPQLDSSGHLSLGNLPSLPQSQVTGLSAALSSAASAAAAAQSVAAAAIPASQIGNTVAPWAPPGYDIIIAAGQSNTPGRGVFDALIDVVDSRVYQFAGTAIVGSAPEPHYQTIISGADPLFFPEKVETGIVGPMNAFLRAYVQTIAPTRRVLVVPVAYGGTGMAFAGTQNDPACTGPCWAPGNPGGVLYENAISQANLAVAAAQAQFPNSRVVGIYWAQGEQDTSGGVSQALYASTLDTLIAGFRSRIQTATSAWFDVMGMVPEWVANNGNNVNLAEIDTPRRDLLTAFTPGVPGHVYQTDNLFIHFDAAGARLNGLNAANAIPRAEANVMGTAPVAPLALSAAPTLGSPTSLTITITPALSRVTDYVNQMSFDGVNWTTVAHSPANISVSFVVAGLTSGVPVYVRTASVNEQGQSAWSSVASAVPLAVPGQVSGLVSGTPTSYSVPVAWQLPASGGAPSAYQIQYKLASSSTWLNGSVVTGLSGSVTGLAFNSSYNIRVLAENTSGNGSTSAPVTASTLPYTPIAPTLSTGSYIFDYEASAGWTDVKGATTATLVGSPTINAIGIKGNPAFSFSAATQDYANITGGTIGTVGGATPGTTTCFLALQPAATPPAGGIYYFSGGPPTLSQTTTPLAIIGTSTGWIIRARDNSGTSNTATITSPMPAANVPAVIMEKWTNNGANISVAGSVNNGTIVTGATGSPLASGVPASFTSFSLNAAPFATMGTLPSTSLVTASACVTGETTADDAAIGAAFKTAMGISP